jgi:GWxTD domain-containing protein
MKNIRIFSRLLSLAALALSVAAVSAQGLNMHVDVNRFLDAEGNTIGLVDYQAPYRNLMFMAQNGGYFARLEVEISIANQDSVIYRQNVTDNIGISSKYDASSQRKSYLNRLVFSTNEPRFRIDFKVHDVYADTEFTWSKELEALPPFSRLSDIELNSKVSPDSSSFLAKFQRNKVVYEPIPSVLLSKNYSEFAYLYMELYSPPEQIGSSYLLNLSLEQDGNLVMDEYLDSNFEGRSDALSLKIPLSDLNAGRYLGNIILQAGEAVESRDFEFVLTEDIEQRYRLFEDADDEYTLMRYFMQSNLPANWAAFDGETKTRYINNFWQFMAVNTGMSEENIIKLVEERVNHANRHYSSLKAGWTSDMGRIYIRNGAPADIYKDTSSDATRFVRKDYQIWKYSGGTKAVYLFIDIQMNNNYRLIYVNGDDMENTNPDWIKYLGSDFDTNLLRN